MSQPFMQLYVADYLGDTRHLTTEQHGAYLLILMTMWRSGGRLPNDAKKLARITGCTPSRWSRIAEEVMEFFRVEGDEITNPRLAFELEKASEKSNQRANAGSLGGKANALKNNKLAQANAPLLLGHSSEPESDKNPPTPQGGPVDLTRFAKALALAADAGCEFETMVERAHKVQPVVGGKRRSAIADVRGALEAAIKRGGKPSAIWLALQAYFALPASTKDGGQYASGSAVILNKDRWKEFVAPADDGAGSEAPLLTFDGPAALRESVVALKGEDFARAWIDPCSWDGANRVLLARNGYAASKLDAELEGWMRKSRVTVAIKGDPK